MCLNKQNIIIFSVEHYQMCKDCDNLIQHELLFEGQNGEENYIRLGLLLYYREIPICLLTNQYTLLGIVDNARAIVHRVVSYLNNKFVLFGIIQTNKK